METLYYVLAVVLAFGIAWFGVWLKNKFKVKDNDINFLKLQFQFAMYLNNKIEHKNAEILNTVLKYGVDAIDFVNLYEIVLDFDEKKALCMDKALEYCEENGVQVDEELVEMLSQFIDFIFANFKM